MTPECDLVVLVYRPDRIRSPISAENEHGDPYRATAEDETRRIDAPAERNEGDARQGDRERTDEGLARKRLVVRPLPATAKRISVRANTQRT